MGKWVSWGSLALLNTLIFFSGVSFADQGTDSFYASKSFSSAGTYQSRALDPDGKPTQDRHLDDDGYGPWMFGVDHPFNAEDTTGIDACYLNEGHTKNGHRDGHCVMGYYTLAQDSDAGLKLTVGLGPYLSYNTTTVMATQEDLKQLGAIAAVVVEKELSAKLGIKVRVEIVHTQVPNSFDGTMVLAGFSKTIGRPKGASEDSAVDEALEEPYGRFSIGAGATQPNSEDGKMSTRNFEIEGTEVTNPNGAGLIYSGIIKHEGNTGVTNRNGFAAQVGYEFRSPTHWFVGGETGPYLEHDSRNQTGSQTGVDLLTKLWVGKQIQKMFVSVVYERVAEFSSSAKDADGFMIELGRKLK